MHYVFCILSLSPSTVFEDRLFSISIFLPSFFTFLSFLLFSRELVPDHPSLFAIVFIFSKFVETAQHLGLEIRNGESSPRSVSVVVLLSRVLDLNSLLCIRICILSDYPKSNLNLTSVMITL